MTYDDLVRSRWGRSPALRGRRRESAVVAPVTGEGEPALLFEVRSAALRTQPGEVCFPGGRVEPGEAPEQAAYRELAEELGLSAPLVTPGPALDLEWHPSGASLTHPFLARLEPGWREALRPNRAEVAEVFTVPLDFFRATPPQVYTCRLETVPPEDFPDALLGFPQGYPWRAGWREVPVWIWEGRPIWGLTARILRGLLEPL